MYNEQNVFLQGMTNSIRFTFSVHTLHIRFTISIERDK